MRLKGFAPPGALRPPFLPDNPSRKTSPEAIRMQRDKPDQWNQCPEDAFPVVAGLEFQLESEDHGNQYRESAFSRTAAIP